MNLPKSIYERIALHLPKEARENFWCYIAHLEKLNKDDIVLLVTEGMAILAHIAGLIPERLAKLTEQWGQQSEGFLGKQNHLVQSANQRFEANLQAMKQTQEKLAQTEHCLQSNLIRIENSVQSAVNALDIGQVTENVQNHLETQILQPFESKVLDFLQKQEQLDKVTKAAGEAIDRLQNVHIFAVYVQAFIVAFFLMGGLTYWIIEKQNTKTKEEYAQKLRQAESRHQVNGEILRELGWTNLNLKLVNAFDKYDRRIRNTKGLLISGHSQVIENDQGVCVFFKTKEDAGSEIRELLEGTKRQ